MLATTEGDLPPLPNWRPPVPEFAPVLKPIGAVPLEFRTDAPCVVIDMRCLPASAEAISSNSNSSKRPRYNDHFDVLAFIRAKPLDPIVGPERFRKLVSRVPIGIVPLKSSVRPNV
jgi:hypothetical protein